MTKGAAYLLRLPLLIFTGLAIIRATKRSVWKPFAAIAVIALALNFGHYARNYELFGSPLGPQNVHQAFLNEAWSPAHLLSRLVRELSLQMATSIEKVNKSLEVSIEKLHQVLGIDTNDPRSTYPSRNCKILYQPDNEYLASAPVHLALVGLLLILSFAFRRDIKQRAFWLLLPVPISCFVLLSAVSKWEPNLNRRLHIPMFLLFAPLIGRVFSHERMKRIVFPVALILLLGIVTTLRWNPRSLIGPAFAFRSANSLLLTFEPGLQHSYEAAANYTNSLSRETFLGLHIQGVHHYQYPLMRLLRRNLYEPHFVAVKVRNVSQTLQSNYSPPNIVVSLSPRPAEIDSAAGRKYVVSKRFDSVAVLVQEESSLPY